MTLNIRAAHTLNSPIYCGDVQRTNAQFHMVPISILIEYNEHYILNQAEKNNNITLSDTSSGPHQLEVWMSVREAYFNYSKYIYNTRYV